MKVSNLFPMRGTYVGLSVLYPGNELLYQHCIDNGINVSKPMFDKKLHTTLIYSRKFCPHIEAVPTLKHIAQFLSYDVFTSQEGDNVLVMKLNAPSISARHLKLMQQHQATYDYPEYLPHITLSYKYDKKEVTGIAPFNYDIILGKEYVEDLNLDYNSYE